MVNWKTFLTSLVCGIMLNGAQFGIPEKVSKPLSAIAIIALGAAAKDKDVTGGTRDANGNGINKIK